VDKFMALHPYISLLLAAVAGFFYLAVGLAVTAWADGEQRADGRIQDWVGDSPARFVVYGLFWMLGATIALSLHRPTTTDRQPQQ